ncbi:glycerate kinase [Vibrio maerlii]|uniref:glycerate kinase n=1 Tax=Vibrio maerlii TaxID=2231648 RepID=UPI000E3B5B84|nr:glycerate kinase [Vibrio maerlii]
MKVVIAPDSFKESLSAKQVCECIERGFRKIFPESEYVHLPLADGGEGTVEVLMQGLQGEMQQTLVSDPLGREVTAHWALLDGGKTALIEVAAASGLDLLSSHERNPATTSTFGTGEVIKAALDCGVEKILLGLGGSATNDGGVGIAQALGAKLLDHNGAGLKRGGLALNGLASIDLTAIDPRCKSTEFVVACDVSNPLIGAHGASAVFGPQKGANAELVAELDSALRKFAQLGSLHLGIDHSNSMGFGAAGGTPLGLSLIFDVQIKPGIEMVLDTLEADTLLQGADLVITGEGQMDNQTLQGKTPFGIARRAKRLGIPVIGLAGSLGKEVDDLYPHIDSLFASVRSPQALPQVLDEASANVERVARNIAANLKLGMQLTK